MAEVMAANMDWWKRLQDAGFKAPPQCTRVIIDAKCNDIVRVYYETLGSKEQLSPEVLNLFFGNSEEGRGEVKHGD